MTEPTITAARLRELRDADIETPEYSMEQTFDLGPALRKNSWARKLENKARGRRQLTIMAACLSVALVVWFVFQIW